MSYNYDRDLWGDNYTSSGTGGGYGQSAGYNSATAAPSGYSNPSATYNDPWDEQEQQQQEQQHPYAASSYEQSPVAAEVNATEQQNGEGEKIPRPPPSFLGRFLRAHVPFCGTCIDLTTPFLDAILKYVNRDLLVSKVFYFFFFSAFGSLFPLMGVYFKQLGMNPAQVGIMTGVRPFIEIFSAPFWNSLAERFQKSKIILLFSLLSWIVFTYSLAHIRPPASACIAFNDTYYVLYTPYGNSDLGISQVAPPAAMAASAYNNGEPPAETNELFMNKMPGTSREKKDEILVNEENVNDQGRRRRRRKKRSYLHTIDDEPREQIRRPALPRFTYSQEDQAQVFVDQGYGSQRDGDLVDMDLENDFEDQPMARRGAGADMDESAAADTFFDPVESSPEYGINSASPPDELEQQLAYASKVRSKRHADEDQDDVLGESEPADEQEEPELRGKSKLRAGGSADDEQEEASSSGEELTPEETAEGAEGGNDENEIEANHARTKHGKQRAEAAEAVAKSEPTVSGELLRKSSEPLPTGKAKHFYRQRHKTPPTHIVGMSPITVEYAINYNKEKHSRFVTPMFSTIVYKLDDVKDVFFLLLLLISLGEFFSAPAVTIADSITLSNLGENTDLYGRQRMFGSIGWGITLLLVGMALDDSKTIHDHPCGPHERERSYTVCFTIFSLLMGCALLTATQFNFRYPNKKAGIAAGQAVVTKTTDNNMIVTTTVDGTPTNVDDLYASTRPREIFNTAPPVNASPPGQTSSKEKFEFLDKWKSAVFAQNTNQLPEWVNVFRQFSRTMHLTYLFITWFLGCGVGLVFTFLFWHLQDVGGTPTLFGICSVINHISEILAYFFSSYFIKRFGHTKVLSVGLGCNVIRFLYVAFLSNPYYALPFELVQGITHAACFAACCSYMSHVSKPELKASTQGVMQGLHNGIGRACGALIGGYMINTMGSRASFCIYGLLSGCVLGGLLYIRKKVSQEEAEVKVDDNENMGDFGAPQGVPSAIPNKMVQSAPTQDLDYQW